VETVTVPNVDGLPLAQANATIEAAGLAPDRDPFINEWMSYERLVKFVRASRGRTLYVHVDHTAKIADEPASTYDAMGNVEVTKPAMLSFLRSTYRNEWQVKALIYVTHCSRCIFVGTGSYHK